MTPGALSALGGSVPRGVERWFAAQGAPPALDLARSGAAPVRLRDLLALHPAAALDELLDLSLDYGAGQGDDRFRAAIAEAGSARCSNEVLVTHGAAEALLLACAAAPRRAGIALVATPAYDGLLAAPLASGHTVRRIPVWHERRAAQLDIAGLLGALRGGGVDLVLVNTPHNPTGLALRPTELERLAAACAAAGALLIVDEVARGTLALDAPSAVATWGFAAGTMIVAADVSKPLGTGGLRCGWLTSASPSLLLRAAGIKDTTTVANAGPTQLLAALALEAAPSLRRRTAAWAACNRDALADLVAHRGGAWTQPIDGLCAYPRLVTGEGSASFASRLRAEWGVAVLPGSLFGHPHRLRLGLGVEPRRFAAALEHIAAALQRRAA